MSNSIQTIEDIRSVLNGAENIEEIASRLNELDGSYRQIKLDTVIYGYDEVTSKLKTAISRVREIEDSKDQKENLSAAYEELNEAAREWLKIYDTSNSSARLIRVVEASGLGGGWPVFEIGIDGLGDYIKYIRSYNGETDQDYSVDDLINEFGKTILAAAVK